MNEEPLNEPAPRKLPKQHVPTAEDVLQRLEAGTADLLYLALNCATGPDLMREDLRTLSDLARTRIACIPNAGLPDEDGRYLQGPEDFTRILGEYLDQGWLNLVGGCCGEKLRGQIPAEGNGTLLFPRRYGLAP